MKIKGQKLEKLNIEIIAIPRANGDDIIFKAQAVLDRAQFEALCPDPTPPSIMRKGDTVGKPDYTNADYIKKVEQQNEFFFDWLFLTSIAATPDLEWETIIMTEPSTWSKYRDELKESKFTDIEIGRIITGVSRANSLDEKRVEEARQRFIAGELPEASQQ